MNVPAGVEASDSGLRGRILETATRLFAEHGYKATSVRQLVEGAGCTKPALYYYFASKEALFQEALAVTTALLTERLEGTMRLEGTTREQITQGLRDFFDTFDQSQMGMRLLMRAELQPDEGQPPFDFVSIRSLHMDMLGSILEQGVKRGELRADIDVGDAANALAGIADQRIRLWLIGQPPPPDIAERIVRIFFDGVA